MEPFPNETNAAHADSNRHSKHFYRNRTRRLHLRPWVLSLLEQSRILYTISDVLVPLPPTLLRLPSALIALRAIRLVQVAKGIEKLVSVVVLSLPSLTNVLSLLLLVLFIYSVLAVQVRTPPPLPSRLARSARASRWPGNRARSRAGTRMCTQRRSGAAARSVSTTNRTSSRAYKARVSPSTERAAAFSAAREISVIAVLPISGEAEFVFYDAKRHRASAVSFRHKAGTQLSQARAAQQIEMAEITPPWLVS